MITLSESQLYKWKTLVALCSIDGNSSGGEHEFIKDALSKRKVSLDQQLQILEGFKTPEDPTQLFSKITEAKDRGALFTIARQLFFQDQDFSECEKRFYEQFKQNHLSKMDLDSLRLQIDDLEKSISTQQSRREKFLDFLEKWF